MEVATLPFPCPLERTVASALLLLSTSPPSLSPSPSPPSAKRSKTGDDSESLFAFNSGNSKSCVSTSSTLTSDDGSSPEIRGVRQLRMVAHADRFHEMTTMKVVRKSRSKTFWISNCRKTSSSDQATIQSSGTTSEITETSSCLSTESSSVSCGRSSTNNEAGTKRGKKELEVETTTSSSLSARETQRKPAGSGFLSGRCEAIMKLLSNGCCISEVRIRQLLGDTPDTSKALRILLKREEVRRSGAGGRTDPYIYKRV